MTVGLNSWSNVYRVIFSQNGMRLSRPMTLAALHWPRGLHMYLFLAYLDVPFRGE